MAIMPLLTSKSVLRENKNSSNKILPPVSIEPLAQDSKSSMAPPLYPNCALACKSKPLGTLYSHALLILTKHHPKSKNQVVHEQKFKGLLSSKCSVRVGGACWTLNPGPVVQYSLGVIFCYCFFLFSCSKDFEVNNGIIANFV